MPSIDRIIQYMQSQGGERVVLQNEQQAMIYRPGGASAPMTKDPLSMSYITTMLNEVMPDAMRTTFASGEPLLFQYGYGSGTVDVDVSQLDGTLRVSVGGSEPPAVKLSEVQVVTELPTDVKPAAVPKAGGATRPISHIDELFRLMKEMEASDLHLSANETPMVRVHGSMRKLDQYEVSPPEKLKRILWDITPKRNQEEWERDHDTDFAYELEGVARFRCNIFADRHGPGAVFRLIPSKVLTADQLGLTKAMLDLCFMSKGLVVVTGPTGSGKSTTLAALVDHVNKHRQDHIITIEDPVEFVHQNINCLVNQREVHVHTNSFSRALRAALREDPDIVLVGEMRDLETVAIAIETAETGHLVFGTLHTTTAATTVDRIIDQFPADQQEQIRVMLSESLKAVIAQTLCRSVDGRRVAAYEILLVDPAAANLIREGKTYQLTSMMQIGKSRGCITMNDSLFAHVKAGRVLPKEAYVKAVDKTGLLGMYEKEGIKLDLSALD
ncbi:MAG: type IV pilus twitching motility protein PilT [Actinomycetota bacterium]